MPDLNFLSEEWQLVRDAPVIAIGGALALFGLAWMVARFAYSREITNLETKITAREAQLDLARDQEQAVSKARAQLEAEVAELRHQIASKASPEQVLATANSTSAALEQFKVANNALQTTLSPTMDFRPLGVTKRSD